MWWHASHESSRVRCRQCAAQPSLKRISGGESQRSAVRFNNHQADNTASALARFRTTYDPRRTSNKLSVARTVGVLDSCLLWAENTPTRPHAPRAFPTLVAYVNSPSTASSLHPPNAKRWKWRSIWLASGRTWSGARERYVASRCRASTEGQLNGRGVQQVCARYELLHSDGR